MFFPSGDRVAYWTTENQGIVIKVLDAASLAEVVTIRDRGTTGCYSPRRGIVDGVRFHFAMSRDSARIVISGQLQVYDAKTGALLADVHQRAFDGLAAAGYRPDARFPGQQNAGTFPLAAAFSPDGAQVVFDGALTRTACTARFFVESTSTAVGSPCYVLRCLCRCRSSRTI